MREREVGGGGGDSDRKIHIQTDRILIHKNKYRHIETNRDTRHQYSLFVGWLLNVPATG